MASGAVAFSLLIMATPALAHSRVSVNSSIKGDNNPGLHLGSTLRISGDRDDDKERKNDDKEDRKDDRKADRQAFLSAIGASGAGVVTSVSGSTFTLKSRGTNSTTTVATNTSTIYKVNGVATTSSALSAGSKVIVFGTTSPTGITASLVSILNVGRGFLKHLFH